MVYLRSSHHHHRRQHHQQHRHTDYLPPSHTLCSGHLTRHGSCTRPGLNHPQTGESKLNLSVFLSVYVEVPAPLKSEIFSKPQQEALRVWHLQISVQLVGCSIVLWCRDWGMSPKTSNSSSGCCDSSTIPRRVIQRKRTINCLRRHAGHINGRDGARLQVLTDCRAKLVRSSLADELPYHEVRICAHAHV